MHGRTTDNGATEHCLLLSPPMTHTTRGRLGRVCAVHSPRLPKAQVAFRLSLLAPLFVFSRLSFRTMLVFLLTISFFCVSLWARINLQRPQAVFLTVLAAHTAVFLDASPSRRVGILSERIQTAVKKCVEASTFFSFFLPRFYLLRCIPSRLQQQCSAQREVSRATLYHPISSQTDYSQVLSSLGSVPRSAPSITLNPKEPPLVSAEFHLRYFVFSFKTRFSYAYWLQRNTCVLLQQYIHSFSMTRCSGDSQFGSVMRTHQS